MLDLAVQYVVAVQLSMPTLSSLLAQLSLSLAWTILYLSCLNHTSGERRFSRRKEGQFADE